MIVQWIVTMCVQVIAEVFRHPALVALSYTAINLRGCMQVCLSVF